MVPILTAPATCLPLLAPLLGGVALDARTILAAPWFAPRWSNPRQPAGIC